VVRGNDYAGHVGRGGRRVLRLPVADHRLVRHGGHRLGHLHELALRGPAGGGGQARASVADVAGRRQQLGGVLAKMVSPQNLAIGAAAVGLGGREGDIFRKVIGWSILLVLIMAVLVLLQSKGTLSWMVP